MDAVRPDTVDALRDVIADASRDGVTLRIAGAASKDAIGRPTPAARTLDMRGFAGVVDYDPPELVLTVRAGTPLAEVQALVAGEGQMLGFDPHGAEGATIGGVLGAASAGPLRLSRGGARDHLLGFEAVSGRAERFIAGGKVVKNVTGYDLPKLMAGSWGRLAALTEVTLKVLPAPRARATLVLRGLDAAGAVAAMAQALGSAAEVSAAAHLPDWQGGAVTAIRLDGFPASIAARAQIVATALGRPPEPLTEEDCAALWEAVRHASPLDHSPVVWRAVVAPGSAAQFVAALPDAAWLFDWAGGLVWLATGADAATVRAAAQAAGGHAALVRAPDAMRTAVPALHPQPSALAAMEARVRRAFDPHGVFETGRF